MKTALGSVALPCEVHGAWLDRQQCLLAEKNALTWMCTPTGEHTDSQSGNHHS